MLNNIIEKITPKSTSAVIALLIWVSCAQSTALGYDASMINALNMVSAYTDYFELTTATLALQSSISWAGAMVSSFFYGWVTEVIGRRKAILICVGIAVVGCILQAASQSVAMFVVARFIVGFNNGATYVCGPTYLAETLPVKWRAVGLGIFMNFYYLGGLLSAGITYGAFEIDSTWAWRLPCSLSAIFYVLSALVIPLVPESPRWLANRGRNDEALEALALTLANGDTSDPVVLSSMQEIRAALQFEADNEDCVTLRKAVRSPRSLRRLTLVTSVAVITMLSGNNIISFYLGAMLTNAGITDPNTQMLINIYLNSWCLVCAMIGTAFVDRLGRKSLAVVSSVLMTMLIFIFGALSKVYGESENRSAIYGTIGVLFLFQGAYSLAWTPLAMLYPPEILNYSLRASGMGLYAFWTNGFGLMAVMAFPFAIEAITWKTYMINGAWDVLETVFILIFWVETKGRTLEEVDELFDGVKTGGDHTNVLDGMSVHSQNSGADVDKLTLRKSVKKLHEVESDS